MTNHPYRALVVDDDVLSREVTRRVLEREGFLCDEACDGVEASQRLEHFNYDVVVTDLRMPNKHGHALCREILSRAHRPLLIVLTGVIEPRLAKDLTCRGVDDVMFKPLHYESFAAKIRGLVDRRIHAGLANSAPTSPTPEGPDHARREVPSNVAQAPSLEAGRISLSDIENKLLVVSRVMPISSAALQVFKMATDGGHSASQLAAAIECDPSLAAEVLRLGNSSFYNPAGVEITRLEAAVARVGQKRIGELALATNALSSLTARMLPWLDVPNAWRRSVAAGLASELLVTQGGHEQRAEGVFLNAIMHMLGRIVLGTLYPEQYHRMVTKCLQTHAPLAVQESHLFPVNHAEVMAMLLATWNIPEGLCASLRRHLNPFSELEKLSEPLRTRAELVKLSALIGQIAAQAWEPWDLVELPPVSVLSRLRVRDLAGIVAETRSNLDELVRLHASPTPRFRFVSAKHEPSGQILYRNLSAHSFDFVAEILSTMGLTLIQDTQDPTHDARNTPRNVTVVVNGVQTPASRLMTEWRGIPWDSAIVVTDEQPAKGQRLPPCVQLPCSYSYLRSRLLDDHPRSDDIHGTSNDQPKKKAYEAWV